MDPASVETPRDPFADLVEAIAAGRDRQAFISLFEHFAPRVKSYLMRLGCQAAEADELAQESLLAVWQKAATFDRRQSSVSTWLFTIARNKRIDAVRRTRRPELDPDDPALVPPAPEQADQMVQAAQSAHRLRAAIADLPADQRELLELAFYEEKSHSDIAAATGLPLGTVKSRIRLAMQRLRTALGES
jgi:RNA polymerase sigma factor (sigma-70 family)